MFHLRLGNAPGQQLLDWQEAWLEQFADPRWTPGAWTLTVSWEGCQFLISPKECPGLGEERPAPTEARLLGCFQQAAQGRASARTAACGVCRWSRWTGNGWACDAAGWMTVQGRSRATGTFPGDSSTQRHSALRRAPWAETCTCDAPRVPRSRAAGTQWTRPALRDGAPARPSQEARQAQDRQ